MIARSMYWLVIPAVMVGLLASQGSARAEESRSRMITLECMTPPSPSPRATTVLVRCRIKGPDANLRTAVALIDPFIPPYWQTMDPFAAARHVALAPPLRQSRLTVVDPPQTSASELLDPFAPSDREASDEP